MGCCPVRCCGGVLNICPEKIDVDHLKLEAGIGRLPESQLESSVVFCPLCESVGVETPTLCKIDFSDDPKLILQVACRCPECFWEFCGVCRSPCHPGEPCLAQGQRAKRMATRRPSLPEKYVEAAHAASATSSWSEARKHEKYEMDDFDSFRRSFLTLHRIDLFASLKQVFGETKIEPAPLAFSVRQSFMTAMQKAACSKSKAFSVHAGFHGTCLKNHKSICDRGLLIPGQSNELTIVNGAAHGRGVYVAQKHAAWLSFGFCSSPKMFICAVLDVGYVTYPGDAMVVARSTDVVPLFIASGSGFQYAAVVPSTLSRKAQRHLAVAAGNTSKSMPLASGCGNRKTQKSWCDEEYDMISAYP